MDYLLYIFILIFGAIIGSFLNVVILRYRTGMGVKGRSKCFSCARTLEWQDLIPIFSFIALRGKCRSCRSSISWQYPAVEAGCAVLFLLFFLKFIEMGNYFSYLEVLFYWIISSILLIIFVYDLRHKIIPDSLSYSFIFLSLVWMLAFNWNPLSLLAGFFFFIFPFAGLWLVSGGRWIGLADAKLAMGIGFLLGFSSGLAAIFSAFIIGAVYGIAFLLIRRLSKGGNNIKLRRVELPFAPFMIAGILLVLFFNLEIMDIISLEGEIINSILL